MVNGIHDKGYCIHNLITTASSSLRAEILTLVHHIQQQHHQVHVQTHHFSLFDHRGRVGSHQPLTCLRTTFACEQLQNLAGTISRREEWNISSSHK